MTVIVLILGAVGILVLVIVFTKLKRKKHYNNNRHQGEHKDKRLCHTNVISYASNNGIMYFQCHPVLTVYDLEHSLLLCLYALTILMYRRANIDFHEEY